MPGVTHPSETVPRRTARRVAAWRGWFVQAGAILLYGCATVPPAPRHVAVILPHRVVRIGRHPIRHSPKPKSPVDMVQLNQPLIRALERSSIPWEAPEFTDARLAFPSVSAAVPGTDAATQIAQVTPTIIVHPKSRLQRTAATAGRPEP